MIDLYTWTTPNGRKVSIALEELGLPYTAHAIDISQGRAVPAGLPEDRAEQPHPGDRRPRQRHEPDGVGRDPDLSRRQDRQAARATTGEARYRAIEWLMWQMGGPGPMLGQVHHFVKYNKGKAPYAEERYLKEAHRLYGVLDRRLAEPRIRRGRLFDRRHRDLAVDLALRVADDRHEPVSEREALVRGDRQSPGGAEGLQGAEGRRRSPDAVRRAISAFRCVCDARSARLRASATRYGRRHNRRAPIRRCIACNLQ